MIKKLVAVTVLSILLSPASYAGFTTGNELANHCEEDYGSFAYGVCYGYVMGTADLFSWINPEFKVCIPPTATAKQVVSIVRKKLKEDPELLHMEAEFLILRWLSETFPCPD